MARTRKSPVAAIVEFGLTAAVPVVLGAIETLQTIVDNRRKLGLVEPQLPFAAATAAPAARRGAGRAPLPLDALSRPHKRGESLAATGMTPTTTVAHTAPSAVMSAVMPPPGMGGRRGARPRRGVASVANGAAGAGEANVVAVTDGVDIDHSTIGTPTFPDPAVDPDYEE